MRYLYIATFFLFSVACSESKTNLVGKSRTQISAVLGDPLSIKSLGNTEILQFRNKSVQVYQGKGLAEFEQAKGANRDLTLWFSRWKSQDLMFAKQEVGVHGNLIRLEVYNKKQNKALVYNVQTNEVEQIINYDGL